MKRKKFLHLLLLPFMTIILLTLAAVAVYASHEYRQTQMAEKRALLKAIGGTLALRVVSLQILSDPVRLADIAKNFSQEFAARITFIATDGTVLYDTEKDPKTMQNHGARVEVAAAFRGETGYDMHYSKELRKYMVYCAVPVRTGKNVIGAVRCSYELSNIEAGIAGFYHEMIFIGLIALGFAALCAWLIARHISAPLEEMRRGADRFSMGDFSRRIPSSSIEEIGLTADTMNHMAAEIASRISTIERERSEKEKILGSMSEGVMALDGNDRILYLNNAMLKIFNITRAAALGSFLHEVIRVPEIQRLVASSLAAGEELIEERIHFTAPTEKNMQAHAVPLPPPEQSDHGGGTGKNGALLVFNDITQLTRLERTRQDFVANVSHELRTPITSIMGFVETLIEGASHNPEKAQRFLGIIRTQTARMVTIIDDLLLLSRLDSQADLPMELMGVQSLVSCVLDNCNRLAEKKMIKLEATAESDLYVRGNSHLLEQALVNLLNNAIHYSNNLTTVRIRAHSTGNEAVIAVIDEGCGISASNLTRIFERFYRVDKARSPNGGGTGLGLSIVKHIALIHSGRIEVESQPGCGSTFRLVLPLPQEN